MATQYKKQVYRKVYVNVTTVFDSVGHVQPQSIQWVDGRIFKIKTVRDFQPAGTLSSCSDDRYVVVINGQEKMLYFERVDPMFVGRLGRWYVELAVS